MSWKVQGNKAIGIAISHFLNIEYTVCLPINDSQCYDLIVEKDNVLYTVQVKSTTYKRNGNYVAELKTAGGTAGKILKTFNKDKFIDILFIVTPEGYFDLRIKELNITNTSSITMGDTYKKYMISNMKLR